MTMGSGESDKSSAAMGGTASREPRLVIALRADRAMARAMLPLMGAITAQIPVGGLEKAG